MPVRNEPGEQKMEVSNPIGQFPIFSPEKRKEKKATSIAFGRAGEGVTTENREL